MKQTADQNDMRSQKAIAKQFILRHLAANEEACDLLFAHRIRYEHPAVCGEAITRAIGDMLNKGELKVIRWEVYGFDRINFLALA